MLYLGKDPVSMSTISSDYFYNIAEAYSPSATYAIGEYCIYNNTLYKCNTEINEAEEWNEEHWTATTVADELEIKGYLVSPVLAGTPTGPTASAGTSTTQLATTEFVMNAMEWGHW